MFDVDLIGQVQRKYVAQLEEYCDWLEGVRDGVLMGIGNEEAKNRVFKRLGIEDVQMED